MRRSLLPRASPAVFALVSACHAGRSAPPPAPTSEAPVIARPVAPPVPVSLPSYDRVRPNGAILTPDFPQKERRRAWLAEAGPIYWTLEDARREQSASRGDGSALERERGTVVVAERQADHLRVRWQSDGLTATFYARKSDFAEVTAKATTLRTVGGAPFAGGCGVTLPPGTSLRLGASAGDYRSATFERAWIVAEGAVPDGAIDRIYRAVDVESPTSDVALVGPTTLRDAPRGDVLAELKDDVVSCRRRGAPVQGQQLLACHRNGIGIVGYAPETAIEDQGLGRIGTISGGSGGGWAISHASFLYLWPGDRLSAPGGADPVAVVDRRRLRVVDRGPDPDGRHQIDAYLHPWDFLSLRIDPQTHRHATERHQAWLARVRFEGLTTEPATATEEMRITLRWLQRGVARCYDRFLARTPATPMAYDVSMVVDADPPLPSVTPRGKPRPKLHSCLQRALRSRRRILYGTTARFTLRLNPDATIAPPETE